MNRPRRLYRPAALMLAVGSVVAMLDGQAAIRCVVFEQAALVLAVLAL